MAFLVRYTSRRQRAAANRYLHFPYVYKAVLCQNFLNGYCVFGENCINAHCITELKRHPKYKTKLCRNYNIAGFCYYGPFCQFIHRIRESRKGYIATNITSSNLTIDGNTVSLPTLPSVSPQNILPISNSDQTFLPAYCWNGYAFPPTVFYTYF